VYSWETLVLLRHLLDQGLGKTAIAEQTGVSRGLIYHLLRTGQLDRLLHHVAVVHIDGQSYRLRELGALLSPTREPPRPPDGRTT
jgi:hypothetical protein